MDNIIRNWGGSAKIYNYAISWSYVQDIIDWNDVFTMRWAWSGGGAHHILGYGYDTSGSRVRYFDPWPGEGKKWKSYKSCVKASDHTWTNTMDVW